MPAFDDWGADELVDDDDPVWLYRGVPAESPEVADVEAVGEIEPPRPDRRGEYWRWVHTFGGDTDTAYTSWSSDPSIARDFAEQSASRMGLSGRTAMFRVRIDDLNRDQVYEGRGDEFEFLIEGRIENVRLLEDDEED